MVFDTILFQNAVQSSENWTYGMNFAFYDYEHFIMVAVVYIFLFQKRKNRIAVRIELCILFILSQNVV